MNRPISINILKNTKEKNLKFGKQESQSISINVSYRGSFLIDAYVLTLLINLNSKKTQKKLISGISLCLYIKSFGKVIP